MSIYEKLGVKRIINAWGTITSLGGSLMLPEVIEAMDEAAKAFVDMDELQRQAGKVIAEKTGAEAAYATSGAAAALVLAVAACMTGKTRKRWRRYLTLKALKMRSFCPWFRTPHILGTSLFHAPNWLRLEQRTVIRPTMLSGL